MKQITHQMAEEWIAAAVRSTRLRTNYNIHESLSDPIQRLFVAAGRGSYFRPHLHLGKSELAIVLRGCFEVFTFDAHGLVAGRVCIGPAEETFALEIPADTFHTWIPLAEVSVFFEVKKGPYDPATSMVFAPWAPEEGSPDTAVFQSKLLAARTGDRIA